MKPVYVWPFAALILLAGCSPSPSPTPEPTASTPVAAPADPVASAQAAVQKAPSFENLTALGLAYSIRGNHAEALTAFERALTTSPRSPLALNNICSQHNDLRHWRQGIETCQKALDIEPGYVLAKNNLAVAQRLKAAHEAKVANLEKAIKEGKSVDRNHVELGLELFNQGDYNRAVSAWTQIPEKSDQFPVAQNDLATVYIINKQFELAKSSLSRALARDPKNQLYLNNQKWLQSAQAGH